MAFRFPTAVAGWAFVALAPLAVVPSARAQTYAPPPGAVRGGPPPNPDPALTPDVDAIRRLLVRRSEALRRRDFDAEFRLFYYDPAWLRAHGTTLEQQRASLAKNRALLWSTLYKNAKYGPGTSCDWAHAPVEFYGPREGGPDEAVITGKVGGSWIFEEAVVKRSGRWWLDTSGKRGLIMAVSTVHYLLPPW